MRSDESLLRSTDTDRIYRERMKMVIKMSSINSMFLESHKNIQRNVFLVAPAKRTILTYSTTPTNPGWLQLHSEDKEIHKTVILHIITRL